MTTLSNTFLGALNDTIKTFLPKGVSEFTLRLPLDDLPAHATYGARTAPTSAHDVMTSALFLQKVKDLFEPGNPGQQWLEEAQILSQPAQEFGFYSPEEIEDASYKTRHITAENKQPFLKFHINEKWQQIDHVFFRDAALHKNSKNPIGAEFKVLKKQEELTRFFHLLSSFQGPMLLWRVYYFKQNVTLRAPTRAQACFIAQALLNAKKSLKSDTYAVEEAYTVFCSAIEPDHVIDSYQKEMKAIHI